MPFLGIYPDKTIIKKDTCTPIFWASLVAQTERILLQCRRPGFNPWVGKIPWGRERLPTPVFWRGKFHGLYNPWGRKELDMAEQHSLHLFSYLNLLVQFWPQSLFHRAV